LTEALKDSSKLFITEYPNFDLTKKGSKTESSYGPKTELKETLKMTHAKVKPIVCELLPSQK